MRVQNLCLESLSLVSVTYFSVMLMTSLTTTTVASMPPVLKGGESRYCGSNLVDTLAFVCDGQYHYRKRFDFDVESGGNNADDSQLLSDNYPNLQGLILREVNHQMNPLSYLVKRAAMIRNARGAHNDCCERPCGYRTLMRYCAATTTLRPSHRISTNDVPLTQRSNRDLQLVNEY